MAGRHKGNRVRIIGGEWRSRLITFPDARGLRPSTDRVRETLFNWLQPVIAGTRCLDLFAGSGVLAFEALSRGAAEAVLIERDANTVNYLKQSAQSLDARGASILHMDGLAYIRGRAIHKGFDLVFLDPPFGHDLLNKSIRLLHENHWLNNDGLVYIEAEQNLTTLNLPAGWHILKDKQAGQVHYLLIQAASGPQETQV